MSGRRSLARTLSPALTAVKDTNTAHIHLLLDVVAGAQLFYFADMTLTFGGNAYLPAADVRAFAHAAPFAPARPRDRGRRERQPVLQRPDEDRHAGRRDGHAAQALRRGGRGGDDIPIPLATFI